MIANFLELPSKIFPMPDLPLQQYYYQIDYATSYVIIHAFPKDKRPSIFCYIKACHHQVLSGLFKNVGLIQIPVCFLTVAAVLHISEKTVYLFRKY